LYCSDKCSARARNRRYYRTIKGRRKKQELARGYFQRHKQELYDKKAARLDQMFREELATDMGMENIPSCQPDLIPLVEGKLAPAAMRRVRFWHDFHPQQFRDWHGKVRWQIDWEDGKLKPYWIRGIHREELQVNN
jgi:hypothetical protein